MSEMMIPNDTLTEYFFIDMNDITGLKKSNNTDGTFTLSILFFDRWIEMSFANMAKRDIVFEGMVKERAI